MNCKTIWRGASALTAAFTFSSLAACSSLEIPQFPGNGPSPSVASEPTVFICLEDTAGQWVTVAQKGDIRSPRPMLTWNTVEFGSNWPPERRCQHVTDKLTLAVYNNGGLLENLALTYGRVNDYMTICVGQMPATCDANNLLFTLSEKNQNDPEGVLRKIADFAKNDAAFSPINESGRLHIFLEDIARVDGSSW